MTSDFLDDWVFLYGADDIDHYGWRRWWIGLRLYGMHGDVVVI